MLAQDILNKLQSVVASFGQQQLLEQLPSWSEQEILSLFEIIKALPPDLLHKQRQALHSVIQQNYLPFSHYVLHKDYAESVEGRRSIVGGKVACVIMAGGQGSRLGWSGPKALFPIFPKEGKTLLQIHLERIRDTHTGSPVAIMCSPLNRSKIDAALQQARNYGLAKGQVELFVQDVLPLLNSQENWFLESRGRLSQGPDGNGKLFHCLVRAGILQRWQKKGIEHVVVIPVDNPLARPLDTALLDFHLKKGCDVTTAAVFREDPEEKVGVFAISEGKACVAEYSEIEEKQRAALQTDGSLLWNIANINIFVFRMQFIERLVEHVFPWHVAAKQAHCYSPINQKTEEIRSWKLETFLFDALPLANRMAALVYPREQIYAPLKNATGDRSPETVRAALRAYS